MNINGPIHVSAIPPTQPAMRPARVAHPSGELMSVFEGSEEWDMGDWTTPSLVVSRSALKHMLQLVEREMGQRKLMPPYRETR